MAGSVNKGILIGNLGPDPEVRYTPSRQAVGSAAGAAPAAAGEPPGAAERPPTTSAARLPAWRSRPRAAASRPRTTFRSSRGLRRARSFLGTCGAPDVLRVTDLRSAELAPGRVAERDVLQSPPRRGVRWFNRLN